jgi:hypothetical protein
VAFPAPLAPNSGVSTTGLLGTQAFSIRGQTGYFWFVSSQTEQRVVLYRPPGPRFEQRDNCEDSLEASTPSLSVSVPHNSGKTCHPHSLHMLLPLLTLAGLASSTIAALDPKAASTSSYVKGKYIVQVAPSSSLSARANVSPSPLRCLVRTPEPL